MKTVIAARLPSRGGAGFGMFESSVDNKTCTQSDAFCPPQAQLRNYVAGRLNSVAIHPLFAHLQRCPICGKNLGNYCRFFSLKEAQLESSELS
jgi:hypothetical protein